MEESSSLLFQYAKNGENAVGLFAQFGGQGVAYLQELRALYKEERSKRLIESAASTLSEQANSTEAR